MTSEKIENLILGFGIPMIIVGDILIMICLIEFIVGFFT